MNIFIAGLSYSCSDSELGELFSAYGEVSSAKIISDRETGRSKGYGFVEMNNDSEAQKAIEELNGQDLKGRNITVSEARPKTDSPRHGSDRGPRHFDRD